MSATPFGTMPNGTPVEAVMITAGALSATVITFGAVIQDIRLEGVAHPLVLGFPTLEGYLRNPNYFGAVAGRYANRIAGGHFALDGTLIQLQQNEGVNQLHGGADGFGTRVWTLLRWDASSVTLGLVDEAGTNGYPGTLTVELIYSIKAPATLRTSIRATTDAPTIVNLAQHSYFNLAGHGDILGHELTIPAETYLPIDAGKIPTGERRPVTGTDFDFRAPRPIGKGDGDIVDTYDHNLIVTDAKTETPHLLARLVSPESGVALDVQSTEPGVQFYSGHMITVADAGINGEVYGANSGLCLEPQLFPDSPNQPGFPSAVLRPGEVYCQETLFAFSRG
jgi:aldose 1-epimerase